MDGKELVHGEITEAILIAAGKVHARLGAGLLERPYKVCLGIELDRVGIAFQTEKTQCMLLSTIK